MKLGFSTLVVTTCFALSPLSASAEGSWDGLSFGLGVGTAADDSSFASGEVSYLFPVASKFYIGPVLSLSGMQTSTSLPTLRNKYGCCLDYALTGKSRELSHDFSFGVRIGVPVFEEQGLFHVDIGHEQFTQTDLQGYVSFGRPGVVSTESKNNGAYGAVGYQHRLRQGGSTTITNQIKYGEVSGLGFTTGIGFSF
jgi:hypothetical protein